MIRDITIGQYYPAKSILHRLDPRVKVVSTLLFLISLFLFRSIPGYIIATAFLVMVVRLSKVPFGYIVKGLKPIIMILMLTVLFQLFLTRGGDTLVHWWIFTITEEGLVNAVYMAIRLIYLIIGSSLMTFTTTPNELTDAIEKLLGPLNKIHIPVHEIAMTMSIALRFIPILLGGDGQDYEGTELPEVQILKVEICFKEQKAYDSNPCTAFCICVPPCK